MAQSKVNRENYIVVQGWMLTDLHLKGNELLIYACIYGFSQLDGQVYSGSLQYLADWTNTTKRSVMNCLNSLVEKGYIGKTEKYINNVKFCEYCVKNFYGVVKKVQQGSEKNSIGGGENFSPNNIDINNLEDNKEDTKVNYQLIADMYNNTCSSLPRVMAMSEKRKTAIRARLRVHTLDELQKLFIKAEASSFLKGANNRNWAADFDWLINENNMVKVLEGKYDDKEPAMVVNNPKYDLTNILNAKPEEYEGSKEVKWF